MTSSAPIDDPDIQTLICNKWLYRLNDVAEHNSKILGVSGWKFDCTIVPDDLIYGPTPSWKGCPLSLAPVQKAIDSGTNTRFSRRAPRDQMDRIQVFRRFLQKRKTLAGLFNGDVDQEPLSDDEILELILTSLPNEMRDKI